MEMIARNTFLKMLNTKIFYLELFTNVLFNCFGQFSGNGFTRFIVDKGQKLSCELIMKVQGVPHQIRSRQYGSKLRFGDKSENLRRMNHWKSLIRLIKNFVLQTMLDFRVLFAYFGVKDWR